MINRLIIIGNGFDLAHSLRTKYCDFVEDYYSNIDGANWNDNFYEINNPNFNFHGVKNLNELIDNLRRKIGGGEYSEKYSTITFGAEVNILVKNNLFYHLSNIHSIENWVDIENEYFSMLLYIIDTKKSKAYIKKSITKLNLEMDEIANRFERYLNDKVVPEIKSRKNYALENFFINKNTNTIDANNSFFREFSQKSVMKLKSKGTDPNEARYWETLVLNFNYTNTLDSLYRTVLDTSTVINIHGELNNRNNPINLGFGDEMSKRYGDIEDLNENEYLRLMKSFAYSNTDNYKRLFDFIESEDFQVQVMGHSCGTSDRTLLNAIFENHNCKSIKVFYYKNNNYDNYSDIVRNISRHFNQKAMMREKIVNKEYCTPLPQFEHSSSNI